MASIYNIQDWTNQSNNTYTSFSVNNIVKHNNFYWYCTKDHTNSGTTTYTPTKGSVYWGGVIYSTKLDSDFPYFIWSPSFGVQASHQPRVHSISFGDGYQQRSRDGVHSNLLKFTLSFESRTEAEALAIVHFLEVRGGVDTFYFKAPPPYSMMKKFVSPSWQSVFNFKDNYNVSVEVQEVS